MKKNKIVLILFLVLILLLGLFVTKQNKNKSSNTNEDKKLLITLVLDKGGVNDESFNQLAWEGAKKAKEEYGVEVKYLESKQESDYTTNIETAVDLNSDLIIGIGFNLSKAIEDAALNYPDQKFAIIDGSFKTVPKNVGNISFSESEAGYLTGLVAGKTSKTNKFGFIGGMQVPAVLHFKEGFEKGIKEANPNADLVVQYANSFVDASKGKAIAQQMYNNGIDIIMTAGGGVNNGVYETGLENGKYAVAVDMAQNHISPNVILTSALKNVDVGVKSTIKELKDGNFKGGNTTEYNIKNDGVGYEKTKLIPDDIIKFVDSKKESMKK